MFQLVSIAALTWAAFALWASTLPSVISFILFVLCVVGIFLCAASYIDEKEQKAATQKRLDAYEAALASLEKRHPGSKRKIDNLE